MLGVTPASTQATRLVSPNVIIDHPEKVQDRPTAGREPQSVTHRRPNLPACLLGLRCSVYPACYFVITLSCNKEYIPSNKEFTPSERYLPRVTIVAQVSIFQRMSPRKVFFISSTTKNSIKALWKLRSCEYRGLFWQIFYVRNSSLP